jgi:hypothetical protein
MIANLLYSTFLLALVGFSSFAQGHERAVSLVHTNYSKSTTLRIFPVLIHHVAHLFVFVAFSSLVLPFNSNHGS